VEAVGAAGIAQKNSQRSFQNSRNSLRCRRDDLLGEQHEKTDNYDKLLDKSGSKKNKLRMGSNQSSSGRQKTMIEEKCEYSPKSNANDMGLRVQKSSVLTKQGSRS